jgi:NAD-dependent DNA ligase
MIIQGNKEYIRNVKDNPKYAFAYKMTLDTNLIEADVEEVEWNISKYKLLKPRIRIKPVHLNGVTITYTSGFNAKYIVENNIGKGTKLLMTRSGDVIPFIVKVIKASKSADMPKMSYSWNTNKVDIKVDEDEDNISDIKLLTSFFAGIGIKNVSHATVTKIFNAGYTSLLDILKATKEDFEEIDGFGKTLAEKVYNNIHNGLQNTTMYDLLGSCGMLGENIGTRKIKLLLDNIPDLFKIYKKMSEAELIERINNIKGFSDITTIKIVENIEKADIFLTSISKYVSFEKEEKKDNEFENMKFLFSGFRDKDLEKIIIQKGGTMVTSISKNTSVLIVKDVEEKSSKIQKAKELKIPVITRDEFIV